MGQYQSVICLAHHHRPCGLQVTGRPRHPPPRLAAELVPMGSPRIVVLDPKIAVENIPAGALARPSQCVKTAVGNAGHQSMR